MLLIVTSFEELELVWVDELHVVIIAGWPVGIEVSDLEVSLLFV